ncbi:MAG: class I SAM-dependent methyltransferase [Gemmatimonadota bacterium]
MTRAFDAASYADPHGRLLAAEGAEVRRAIYPHHRPVVGRVLADSLVRRLMQDGRLIPAQRVEGDPAAPEVLAHPVLWPVTYPAEWPAIMLADAGLLLLELARELLASGFCLDDGTPRNVLFDRAAPVFVDFTSVVDAPGTPVWRPFDQFSREVLHPLYLSAWDRGAEWRYVAITQPRAGVAASTVVRAMPLSFRLRRPIRAGVLGAMARLERNAAPAERTSHLDGRAAASRSRAHLELFFRHLEREVQRLRRQVSDANRRGWVDYYDADVAAADTERKTRAIGELLQRLAPRRLLDLGTNTGRYAIMAAELGVRVVAVDADEGCLTKLYETARRRHLAVTPLLMDAACPTPAFGLGGTEFPSAATRLSADVTMALGVVHHLVRRSDYTLDRIGDALTAFGSRVVVLEFVGPGDPRAAQLGLGRRPGYTLEAAQAALGRQYARVTTLPVYGDRQLVVGERQ